MELEDHVPVYIPEPEHPEDLVPAEDEAPTPPLPPFFLSPRIRPPHTRAAMRQMRAAAPSTYHSLLPSGTPPLLPIPLPAPSTSRRADIPEADTPPRKRLLLTTPRPSCEVGESSAAAARQPGPTMAAWRSSSSCEELRMRYEERETCLRARDYGDTSGLWLENATKENAQGVAAEPWLKQKQAVGEIKKIETEMWNLKVRGTDVVAYSRRFQQLALMCSRMFPEEIDKIEKYIGGLPDMIHGSVKASKPKTMQEAIEFTTELMDEKTHAYAERQAERKRKYDDLSKNNQNQQQQNKRQNTGQAYTAGNSDRKSYAGSKPLCSKCNYNHEGPCPPKCSNCKRVGHLAKDCRSRPANANNNNRNNNNNNQKGNGLPIQVRNSRDIVKKTAQN
ncbi:putative reverse transcriptase domain-containing protein [Tanacetum coccineum]|uniref:Reverse transcriptase domain-containing protein n=1 Tax=Tanacetum coccineum TaxID=301880 RepID=A0ABQ5FY33_9ASTR